MELKNLMHNNSTAIILNRLKEKKNWFLVSLTIMLITVIILPVVMGNGIDDENIVIGMVEVFFLVFINCMIDFSYLHDSRKLSYNISKPITDMQKINIIIIVNIIFTTILVGVLGLIAASTGGDYYLKEVFMVAIPWLITGIFTAALSSVLVGNTIVAGFATIINFTLPMLVLGVINFFFSIVEDIAVGFNSSILFNVFLEKVYRIDILYFVKYVVEGFDFTYFIVLALVVAILYSLILIMSKRRKHERAGDLVVIDGYKSVISVLLAALTPAVFVEIFYYADFTGKMISFVLLSALAFYLINAILEKSFRINQFAVKLFIGFIVFFLLFIVVSDIMTERYEKKVPLAIDVEAVYVNQNTRIYSYEEDRSVDVYEAHLDFVRQADGILYDNPGNIQSIINMHKEVIKNQEYYYDRSFVLVYYMKDGERLYRYYNLKSSEEYIGEKDRFITNLVKSEEFKKEKFQFIYDNDFFNSLDIQTLEVTFEDKNYKSIVIDLGLDDVNLDILRWNMVKDYDNYLSSCGDCLQMIVNNLSNNYSLRDNYYHSKYRQINGDNYLETEIKENDESYKVNLFTSNNDKYKYRDIYLNIDSSMVNTFEYIDGLINN